MTTITNIITRRIRDNQALVRYCETALVSQPSPSVSKVLHRGHEVHRGVVRELMALLKDVKKVNSDGNRRTT